MLTFLSRFKVKPEKEAEFVDLVHKLTAAVRENEPGALQYQFYRQRDTDYGYAVFESFTDHEAEEAHLNSAHFKAFGTPMIECLDGAYVREYLDDID